jgi:hypothetical protein
MNYSIFFIFFSYIAAPKFCVNCVHFTTDKNLGDAYGTCNLFPVKEQDTNFLITGEHKINPVENYFCSSARTFNWLCGERGRLFFPKTWEEESIMFSQGKPYGPSE